MSLSKRILGEDGGPGHCVICGFRLDRGDDFPEDEHIRSHGGTWKAHAECAERHREERDANCGSGEHEWGPDLADNPECERGCGLRYDEWTEEA